MLLKYFLSATAAVSSRFVYGLIPPVSGGIVKRDLTVDDGYSMKWTGRIFPGEEPTVLWGTAKEIYEHILSINPNYIPEPSDTAGSSDQLSLNSTVLQARATISCAVMATGDKGNLGNAINYLNSIGGTCGAPTRDCRRMTCQNTSGSYICSEADHEIAQYCPTVASYVAAIRDACCPNSSGVSGHYYSSDFSVWEGYANCNFSPNKRPTDYPYPGGGVNPGCF